MTLKTMERFGKMREENIDGLTRLKKDNKRVVGAYCLYSPYEVVLAANAVPIGLCGTSNKPVEAAEKVLPRNLCSLIKSSYGFAATDTCPFFDMSDILIAETTCDGKKKMYELLSEYKPLHLLQLPQNQDPETALPYWYKQVELLKERLEKEFAITISQEDLRKAVDLMNRFRAALKELQDTAKAKPAPISGMNLLTAVHNIGFAYDKEEAINIIKELTAEVKENHAKGISPFTKETPRILLTGVPVGVGSHKVIQLIEECGGNVVCLDSCTAYKGVLKMVDEDKEPLLAIAEKYLDVHCSCMSPNTKRFEAVAKLVQEFHADGVIDLTWIGCHTFNVESYSLRKYLQENNNTPFLQIETDYSESDIEQLKVRIQAFLEMLS